MNAAPRLLGLPADATACEVRTPVSSMCLGSQLWLSFAKVFLAVLVAVLLPALAHATAIQDAQSVWKLSGKRHTLQISFRVTEPNQQKCDLELWTNNALSKVLESKMLGNKPEQQCRFLIRRDELPADVSEAGILVRIGSTMKALRIPDAPALAAPKPSIEITSVTWSPEAELTISYTATNAKESIATIELWRGDARTMGLAQVDFSSNLARRVLTVPFEAVRDYAGCHVVCLMDGQTVKSGPIPHAPKPSVVIERLSWNSIKDLELRTLVTGPQGMQAVVELWKGKRKLKEVHSTTLSLGKTARIDLGIPFTTMPEVVGGVLKIRVGEVLVTSKPIEAPR